MLLTRDDFRIKAESFDLSNGLNIIRIICGLFMFPHVAGKFAAGAVSAGTAGFFAKAGFHPPKVWVVIASRQMKQCRCSRGFIQQKQGNAAGITECPC
jgi:putative oxidoreductase